jgi:hypothetical protein
MFAPERKKVTGEWRKLHSQELRDLSCSPSDEVKEKEMGRACGMYALPGLANAGTDCFPCGGHRKVIAQSKKRTNVLVY